MGFLGRFCAHSSLSALAHLASAALRPDEQAFASSELEPAKVKLGRVGVLLIVRA